MIAGNLVIATAVAYVVLLFGLAYVSDQRARRGQDGFLRSPLIFTLAISVYCTSWTFYGAVGSAARNGLEFLAIYFGPTLVFVFWWFGLRKLVHIGHAQRITSVADLISSRYGKSSRLAVFVTLIAVIGTTPYIALQLKAVTSSLRVMSGETGPGALPESLDDVSLAFIIAAAMALFTVLFGTRNVNANEQHHGVVAAIAFEAVVKLLAVMAVGMFVVFGLGGGFEETFARAEDAGIVLYGEGAFSNRWIAINVLSAAAIICLPRQFQITVVENADEAHLKTASWAFPLYLMLMSLFTMPIAIMGMSLMPEGADPDMFVLTLPLLHDQSALALFAFIGGFSSATSMIIIASIALSIMVSNHIIMPIALRAPGLLDRQAGGSGVTSLLLTSRRISIATILFLGFAYFWLTSGSGALAPIGLISFAGVAQFMPAIIAALYWRDATRQGAMAGLTVGFVLWAYTLFVPSFATSSTMVANLIATGPWGVDLLKPQALLGLMGMDPLVHSVFWSLTANVIALITVSIFTEHDPVGRLQATLFVDAFKHGSTGQPRYVRSSAALNDLYRVAQRVLGGERTQSLFEAHAPQSEAEELIEPTPHFIAMLEKELAGSIGAASAHVMLSQVVSGDTESIEEVIRMADETQQILEYSQRLEQTTEELQSTAKQLRLANEQLRQLDQQKDEFLSQVSHEVRTPMTSIRSFSEILLTHKKLSDAQRKQFLHTIHTESLRLTSLLNEILDLSALERGEKLWANEPVDVRSALQRAIDVCSPISEQHGLDVRLEKVDDPVWVNAHADRICQVFINLISNAAKYNDAETPQIQIYLKIRDDNLTIDFSDNGPGIAAKDRRTIFEKFSRGRHDQRSSQPGSGLGLAISREILANMNGALELMHGREQGARFRVTLPLANAPAQLTVAE